MSLIGQGLSVGFPKIQSCKNQIDRFRTKFGMTNFKKLCAFTLSELLLSLTIVGVIAVITVPVIVGNIQKQIFATKLKNTVTMIEQVAQQELIRHHTRDLRNTDFGNPEQLLTSKHFNILKSCSYNDARKICWKNSGKDKIIYMRLNNKSTTISDQDTVILNNGVILGYRLVSGYDDRILGAFSIDLNGHVKPNIFGRDVFVFYITPKGQLVDRGYAMNAHVSLHNKIYYCTALVDYCYGAIVDNNWKMDY